MIAFVQDFLSAGRMLLRAPGFLLVILSAISIGIAANTAIFTVLKTTLLTPLPYKQPQQLIMMAESNRGLLEATEGLPVSGPNFLAWREQAQIMEDMAAFRRLPSTLTGQGQPERLEGVAVSPALFSLLGIKPVLGRTFLLEEDKPGRDNVVVVSYSFWQQHFGSSADAIGTNLVLDGSNVTIVGVMPPGFGFPKEAEASAPLPTLWKPLALTDAERSNRFGHYYKVLARLKPDFTIQQARAHMDAIARQLEKEYPGSNTGFGITIKTLHSKMVEGVRLPLLMLQSAAIFVLLIVCANVSNLLLARGIERRNEIAVRKALGASRGRLIRQLFLESVLLSIVGGTLGVLLAMGGIRLLVALGPANVPRLNEFAIDKTSLGFGLSLSVAAALLFGLAPSVRESNLNESFKVVARGHTVGLRRARMRDFLVVAQVALSLVLLIAASLMLRSFRRLLSVAPGFSPAHVLTMRMDLPPARYRNQREQSAFLQQVIEELKAVPGVESAGAISTLPLAVTTIQSNFSIEGRPPLAPKDRQFAERVSVSSGAFTAMSIPLFRGRLFNDDDTTDAPPVVIINQAMARRHFPGEDPVGKRLRFGDAYNNPAPWQTIIGLVGDVRYVTLDADPRPTIYVSYLQRPSAGMTSVIHSDFDSTSLVSAALSAIWKIDQEMPISQVQTMDEVVFKSLSQRRFNMFLLNLFAAIGLALALTGIYAHISYSVTQRMNEFGVRMALGASFGGILKLVMARGLLLLIGGLVIGVAAAYGLTRFLSSMLYGVSPTDFTTFGAAIVVITIVSLLGNYIPARRISRADPVSALRSE